MTKKCIWAQLLISSLLLSPPLLAADAASEANQEMKQAISIGSEAYQAGPLSQAVTPLDYAATLIRQRLAGELSN